MTTSVKAIEQTATSTGGPSRDAALLGHDIRAAVSDMMGGLHLLEDHMHDPEARLHLDRVRAVAESLGRMVCHSMAVVSGDGDAASDAFAEKGHVLLDVLRDVELRWATHVAQAGLSLKTDLAADLPILIGTDRLMLERILSNLIDNAAKYADFGTITLCADMRSGGELRFTVRDQGPGFTAAALRRVFEFRARPEGMTQPGSGMGLHIANAIADRLGGRLSVSNLVPEGGGPARGAEVSLILPAASWRSSRDTPIPGALPDLSGKTVLVAEDTAASRIVLCRMMEHMGATCHFVENGRAARDALADGGFDLALVDIEMPLKSGIDVIAETRALPGPRGRIPILAVTAYVLGSHRETIYNAGADGIVAKPVMSLAAFGEAVAALLRRADRSAGGPSASTARKCVLREVDTHTPPERKPDVAGTEHRCGSVDRLTVDSRPFDAAPANLRAPLSEHESSNSPGSASIHVPGRTPSPPVHSLNRTLPAPLPTRPCSNPPPGSPNSPEGAPGIDPARMSHLLDLAGPSGREELLSRLALDLSRSDRTLSDGISGHDLDSVRSATHVLISLSGAVGASALQTCMETMNEAAHRDDWVEVERGARQSQNMLTRVRREIDETWQALGTPYLAGH
ncbi:MAG: ATP-binding protein [Pseudomonadota bacterium]